MRIAFYIVFAVFIGLHWPLVWGLARMGLDIPCDLNQSDADALGAYGIFVFLLYIHALVLIVLMPFARLKYWRIWLIAIMVPFIIVHLTRWHLVTKYPPDIPDERPAWFEERGVRSAPSPECF